MLDVSLLGVGGGMPMPNRFLSSLMINYKGKKILIDCGEGCQVSMRLLGWGFKSLDLILITHLHGDHINGLLGLLSTIGNSGREEPLTVIGPKGMEESIKAFRVLVPYLPYDLNVIEIREEEDFKYKFFGLDIESIYVSHSSPCVAYRLYLKRSRKLLREKAEALEIPKEYWGILQRENFVEHNGKRINPEMVLGEDRGGIKISFVTDTRPIEEIVDFIKESDIFFCEGNYESNENVDKAIMNFHMTFEEAALLAQKGNVKKMILTHFSPSISDPNSFIDNSRNIFEESYIGVEREIISLKFKKE